MLKIYLKWLITALCRCCACFSNVFSLFSAFNPRRFINTPTSSVPCALKSVEWKHWHSDGPLGLFLLRFLMHVFSPVRPKTWLTAAPATGRPPGRRRWSSTARQSSWSTASPARSSDRHVPPTAASATTVWVSDNQNRFGLIWLSVPNLVRPSKRWMVQTAERESHKQTHVSLDGAKVRLIRGVETLSIQMCTRSLRGTDWQIQKFN